MTFPQFNPLGHILVLLRGTQGSWKFWGEEVGVFWAVGSWRGLEEDWEDLLRPGRRLRESDRNGGGGGRLVLRREMLWVMLRELEEDMLDFLFSRFSEGEEVLFSEQKELLSGKAGEE